MTFEELPTFRFFSRVLPETAWDRTRVLDFGGNKGNFVRSSSGKVLEKNYSCIDVDPDAIGQGKSRFPAATWIHYNKFNPVYNSEGLDLELPNELGIYDLIVSYSVFTHISEPDMIKTIKRLYSRHLEPGGCLSFTFLEPSSVDFFLDKRIRSGAQFDRNKALDDALWRERFIMLNDCTFIDDTSFYPKSCKYYLSFYRYEYLLKVFEEMRPKYFPVEGKSPQSYITFEKF